MSTVQLKVKDHTGQKREVVTVQQEEMTWGEVTLLASARLNLPPRVAGQDPAVYHLAANGGLLNPNVTVAETMEEAGMDTNELEFVVLPDMPVGGICRA